MSHYIIVLVTYKSGSFSIIIRLMNKILYSNIVLFIYYNDVLFKAVVRWYGTYIIINMFYFAHVEHTLTS